MKLRVCSLPFVAGLAAFINAQADSAHAGKPGGGGVTPPVYQNVVLEPLYGDQPYPLAVHVERVDGLLHVQCVGRTSAAPLVAFAWQGIVDSETRGLISTTGVRDLNTQAVNGWIDLDDPFGPAPADWRASSAWGVNGSGEVACQATHASGRKRTCLYDPALGAFLLLPVSIATSESAIATGEPINASGDIVYTVVALDGTRTTRVCNTGDGTFDDYPQLPNVRGVSDDGRLVGGVYEDGYAYRLTPSTGALEIFNAIAPRISANGTYVLARAGVARRYTSPTQSVSVSGRKQADPYGGVNSDGDCVVRVFESPSKIWNALYHNGNTFNVNSLIGVPSNNETDFYGMSERDNTGYPWICGFTAPSGELRPLLLMPIP